MSKGLSKMQRAIVGLLDGSGKPLVYASGEYLVTGELAEELQAAGILTETMPRRLALSTVRRACRSLVDRGVLAGRYELHCDHPVDTIAWSMARVSAVSHRNPLVPSSRRT